MCHNISYYLASEKLNTAERATILATLTISAISTDHCLWSEELFEKPRDENRNEWEGTVLYSE